VHPYILNANYCININQKNKKQLTENKMQ